MSNGDEVTRKSHIKRIYKNDDPDSGQWVDIERIDELRFVSKRRFPWREKRWTFDWDSFDPDGDNVTKKKVKQHPDDSDDDAIEVPVRDMVFVTEGREQQYQGCKHYFVNDDSNSTRESHSRRVYHHDIPEDQLDDNKNPPRDPQDYINAALPDKDKDQYVEVEMLDKYWTNEREARDAHGNLIVGNSGIWQEKKWLIDSNSDPLLFDESGNDPDFAPVFNPDAGPQVDPPYRLDPLQNIVNVKWGSNVIVVFVDSSVYDAQPAVTYTPIKNKAEHLASWRTPYQQSGVQPGFPSTAYKVSTTANKFMTSTAPALPDNVSGLVIECFVFAVDSDLGMEGSLNRAREGTKLIIPAIYLIDHSSSDLAADMSPPGLLWLVEMEAMNSGQKLTWNIRYGNHRDDREGGGAGKPPNNMVQCYPAIDSYPNPSGATARITWTGYSIYAYRLDKKGTGTVYGKLVTSAIADNRQNIDPAWNAPISSPDFGFVGIPFKDPPPLIVADLVT